MAVWWFHTPLSSNPPLSNGEQAPASTLGEKLEPLAVSAASFPNLLRGSASTSTTQYGESGEADPGKVRNDELSCPYFYRWLIKRCSGKDATPSNPRGIPYAPFVDKVEDYVASREDVEPTLRSFQEMIS